MEELTEFMKMDAQYKALEYMAVIFNIPLNKLLEKYGFDCDDYLNHKLEMEDEPNERR